MSHSVFISYSTSDKFFAELLSAKLEAAKVAVWRDVSSLVAGEEWRQSIDLGIANSKVMVVVMSNASCASHYVTYEWATALARDRSIVPILLEKCNRHPKLEPLQYIDFTTHSEDTWQRVVQRVEELLSDEETYEPILSEKNSSKKKPSSPEEEFLVAKIVAYMNQKGFRMVSFKRIQNMFGEDLTEDYLQKLSEKHPRFRPATLARKRKGLSLI